MNKTEHPRRSVEEQIEATFESPPLQERKPRQPHTNQLTQKLTLAVAKRAVLNQASTCATSAWKSAISLSTMLEGVPAFTMMLAERFESENRKSKTVTLAFSNKIKNMNSTFKKSLTYDNGIEMANHKWFTENTGMTVYFAHPYSSWERGTNENTNGLIRRFFPKGTDFNKISEEQIREVENKLNNRPRKIINYMTPFEFIEQEKRNAKKGYSDNFFEPQAQKKIIGNNKRIANFAKK
mgnify:CR=1 FL=1